MRVDDEDLEIGATATLHDLAQSASAHALTASLLPAACRAAVPSRLLRGMATIGGEAVAADADSELVAALLALNAVFVIAHPGEPVESPALRFLRAPGADLAGGGVLRAIMIPGAPHGAALERAAALPSLPPLVAVAATTTFSGEKLARVRLSVTGLAGPPARVSDAEALLERTRGEDEALARAAEVVSSAPAFRDDALASADYRRRVAGPLARRALRAAVERGRQSRPPDTRRLRPLAAPRAPAPMPYFTSGRIELTVNGRTLRPGRGGAHDARRAAARRRGLRREGGLRRRPLRRVHRAPRRPARGVVPDARGACPGPERHDDRGPRHRRAPAPAAAGVRRGRRRALRLLHAGARAVGSRSPRGEPGAVRGRGPRGAHRPVPLQRLRTAGGGGPCRRGEERPVSLRRATGQAAFAGDAALSGLLHVAVRRSTLARARVRAVDPSAAVALPGVAAVLTPSDAPALLRGEPRFVGDRLAAVAAEDLELARRAADLLELDLEPLPAVLDAEAAAADDTCVVARCAAEAGDVDGALARAEHVVSGEWRLPFSPSVSLEPPLALTWLDEDRRLVVRTSAESPFRVRGLLAERLGLPAARIRVARPRVAGGAAGRPDLLVEDLCALVTLRTGRPARLALGADEALSVAPARPAQRARVRLALGAGQIAAIDLDLLVDVGAEADPGGAAELLRSAARHALGLYRCGAMRVAAVAVRTNRPPGALARGSDAGAALAVECAVDEAAAFAGADPAAFRRRHVRAAGDPGRELLADLGEAAGTDGARGLVPLLGSSRGAPPRARRTAPPAVPVSDPARRSATGVGVARRAASASAAAGSAAALRLLEDGSFALVTGTAAGGGADETLFAETAAAILTVPPSHVVSAAADTDSAAFDAGDPSPAVFVTRRAVEDTARAALARIREAGARLLGADAAQVAVAAGRVSGPGGRSVSFAEIGRAALRTGEPVVVTTAPGTGAWPPSLAAVEADVEVDAETGVVRVTRLAAAVEGGPFADTSAVLAEVEGALAGAVELALAAGLPFDAAGRPLARDVRSYPLLAAPDVPPIAVTFAPSGEADALGGGAALADAAGRAALAAIVNAVSRATGGRPRELPLSPPRVLDASDARGRVR